MICNVLVMLFIQFARIKVFNILLMLLESSQTRFSNLQVTLLARVFDIVTVSEAEWYTTAAIGTNPTQSYACTPLSSRAFIPCSSILLSHTSRALNLNRASLIINLWYSLESIEKISLFKIVDKQIRTLSFNLLLWTH